ncbi:hypothetical protein D915_007313 [Fasciola hepatica]|uniref:Sex-determining region Y protein n=1 Tax=Fasciola hepatica TaxID=6192 RepID=A0A4E0R3V4_FASHE|nr:hypothetical protein D915_007313 [Fasciola hepatica]
MLTFLCIHPMTLKALHPVHETPTSWANQHDDSTMTTMDPYFFSGTGSILSNATLTGTKLTPSGLSNPTVRRLWFSRSASASPIKIKLSPKRVSISALTSPYKTRRVRPLPDSQSIDSPGKRTRHRPNPRSSARVQRHSSSNIIDSSLLPGDLSTDEGAEFQACDLCEQLCQQSLDAWMDHLGEFHPIPARWPSDRVDSLTDEQKLCPYSAVVGSHKRRRPHITPRPLNSFMIFAQYLRRATLQLFPDAHNVHLSQRIGLIWRQLTDELRQQYSTEASRLLRLHAIEFPDYKYQPKKRIRETEPDSGTTAGSSVGQPASVRSVGARTLSAPAELTSPSIIAASSGPVSEWGEIGYDSPDGPVTFHEQHQCHTVDSQPITSVVSGKKKAARPLSTGPTQMANMVRPSLAYVLHSSDLASQPNAPYIPNTLLCVTDADYMTSYPESFQPCPDNSMVNFSVAQTKQENETLTALVSENQLRNDSESGNRRSSSFLTVLPSPIETESQSGGEWTHEKSRSKALEDLLNTPSLFQQETGQLRTLKLEPLTVVTHVSPGMTIPESSDPVHSQLKQEECEILIHSDQNLLPGSLTPSLSTISPDSSVGQQDSVSVVCATYWDPQKRSDSIRSPVVLLTSRPNSVNVPSSRESARVAPYCPNITWNSTEAMHALSDIAMLIERGLREPRTNTNGGITRIQPSSIPSSTVLVSDEGSSRENLTEFANIDTCGTSPSLEDLSPLILFSGNAQESDSRDSYRTEPQNSIAVESSGVMETKFNGTNETRCLPSISSWTFGGTLSR